MLGLRAASLALALIGMGIWLRWICLRRERWLLAIAPLTWLLNVALFYVARLACVVMPVEAINIWSATIHLHALMLTAGAGVILSRRGQR